MKSLIGCSALLMFSFLTVSACAKQPAEKAQNIAGDLDCKCLCNCSDGTRRTGVSIACDSNTGPDNCPNINGRECSVEDTQGNVITGNLEGCRLVYLRPSGGI